MTLQERIDKVLHQLYKLQEEYPDTEIFIEVPGKVVTCKIGDALIYDTPDYKIAIDAE